MNMAIRLFILVPIAGFIFLTPYQSSAQTRGKPMSADSFLLTRKGWLKDLAKSLIADTSNPTDLNKDLQRNDLRYKRYSGRVIRHVIVQELDFGTSINDTNRTIKNRLTHLANSVHRKTRSFVITNNLFFQQNDLLQPFLVADNERYLRSLPYFQDARINVKPVNGKKDSVDIIITTKDIIGLGASVSSLQFNLANVQFKEDNLRGWGDRVSISALYDQHRDGHLGLGFEYIKRNLGGTFIDLDVGHNNFYGSINGPPQENTSFLYLTKPLANNYMKWTYSLQLSNHNTKNLYDTDSIYIHNDHYQYYNIDSWVGYNVNAQGLSRQYENQRLRGLIGLRLLRQEFQAIPLKYSNSFFWQYANICGVLGSFSVFRQDFYKTHYIYGFGTTEDVPTGVDVSVTGGFIDKQTRQRPYFGVSFERYYFDDRENYFDFIIRSDSYLYQGKLEDINLLGNINYFSHLITLNERWKQRSFLTIGISKQLNPVLNTPLLLESSDFGLPKYNNGLEGGYFRGSLKAESDFFSPWTYAGFKFAPFIFYDGTYFTPINERFGQGNLYSAIGGGIRTRNENLVFGTLELKAYYFPTKGDYNNGFKISITSGLRYKYNTLFIRKPDFVGIN